MPIKGSGTGKFTITYAPQREVAVDGTLTVSAKFDEGFGLNVNKWGNQYGTGLSVTLSIFCVAAEVTIVATDSRRSST
jgi:hypothetical protein